MGTTRTLVEYEARTYDIKSVPATDSKVVMDRKDDVLGAVRLNKLVENLAITGDLINLAYNATPRKYGELRSQVDQLHIRFGDIAGHCVTELGNIKSASQEIGRKVATAFGMLFSAREDVALAMLTQCANDAGNLAKAAGNLASRFDELCSLADKALSDGEHKLGDEIDESDKLCAKRDDLLATQAGLEEKQKQLESLIKTLQAEHDSAKAKLDKTESRAFTLALTGAIMQPLGQALSNGAAAIAAIYAPPVPRMPPAAGQPTASAPTTTTGTPTESQTSQPSAEHQKKLADAKANVDKANAKVEEIEQRITELQSKIGQDKKKLAELSDKERDPEKRNKAADTLNSAIGENQRLLDTANAEKGRAEDERKRKQQELHAAEELVKQLGVALSETGEKLSGMGNDYAKIADGQRKRVEEIFRVLIEKQDIERDTLAQVKESALRLENMGKQQVSAKIVISALYQVIAALKQVVAILHEARLFWDNMAAACKGLSEPTFCRDIKQYVSDFPNDDRVSLFYDNEGFKLSLLDYLAKWRALEVIATEYIQATKNVHNAVYDNFREYLGDEEAKNKVVGLSQKLLTTIDADIKKIDEEIKATKAKQAAISGGEKAAA